MARFSVLSILQVRFLQVLLTLAGILHEQCTFLTINNNKKIIFVKHHTSSEMGKYCVQETCTKVDISLIIAQTIM